MKQSYTFFDGGKIEFDSERSVRELVAYAFDTFGYYEPAGMELVTLFQGHHPDTNTGWITTDLSLKCADEIKDRDNLFFAYYLPNVFYFAEGGWGHHMPFLGNRPHIDDAVSISLRFEDFENTVVVNGKYTFNDIISFLKRNEYIDDICSGVIAIPIGCATKSYRIPFTDPIIKQPLKEFTVTLEKYNSERIHLDSGEFISNTVLEIC